MSMGPSMDDRTAPQATLQPYQYLFLSQPQKSSLCSCFFCKAALYLCLTRCEIDNGRGEVKTDLSKPSELSKKRKAPHLAAAKRPGASSNSVEPTKDATRRTRVTQEEDCRLSPAMERECAMFYTHFSNLIALSVKNSVSELNMTTYRIYLLMYQVKRPRIFLAYQGI